MNTETISQNVWVMTIQVTLLLALGLGASFALRRRGSAWQTNILRTTLVALIVLTLCGSIFHGTAKPIWTVSAPATGPLLTVPLKFAAEPSYSKSNSYPPRFEIAPNKTIVSRSGQTAIPLRDLAILIWALGVAVGTLWMVVGAVALFRLRSRSTQSPDHKLQELVNELSEHMGVRRPRLYANSSVVSPFVSGLLHASIYIPMDMNEQYDSQQLRAILAHEIVHIRHRDCLWGCLARVVTVLAWAHPFVWILQRKLHDSSEELCDQVVLKSGHGPANYAECLLRIAERSTPSRMERLIGIGVVPIRSTLGRRISLVLNTSRNSVTRVSLSGRLAVACSICFAVVALAIAVAPRSNSRQSSLSPAGQNQGDPVANALAKTVRETYAALSSLSADVTVQTGDSFQNRKLHLDYKRPGTAKVTISDRDRLQTGATLFTEPDKFYVTSPHHPGEYLMQKKDGDVTWDVQGSLQMGLSSMRVQGIWAAMWLELDIVKLKQRFGELYNPDKTPWAFGADVTSDGVACKTLVGKIKQQDDSFFNQILVVGVGDHLLRESRMSVTRNGRSIYDEHQTYTHVIANVPSPDTDLHFRPVSGWKEIVKVSTSGMAKQAPAVEAMERVVRSARSLSFVVEEVTSRDGMDRSGKVQSHTTLNRLTVQVSKPSKAHLKLELKDYAHQNLEVWSDGVTEQVVEKGNNQRYFVKPVTKGANLLSEVGIPAGACPTGFSLLQSVTIPGSVGNFRGVQGNPTTFEGEPVDVVVEKQMSEDENGFPVTSSGFTTMLISQRDHMLRKVEAKSTYVVGGKPMSNVSTEILKNFKIDVPIPDAVFRFTPEPGMTPTSDVNDLEPYRKASQNAIDQTLSVGQLAPDFKSTLIDGSPISMSQFKGKVVFLHGWTFGIGNYQTDLPLYEKIYKKFKAKGLILLGIPYEQGDSRKSTLDWLNNHTITHPQVFDGKGKSGGVQQVYKMGGRPFVFIIDRDGVVFAKPSFNPDIEKLVQDALDKK